MVGWAVELIRKATGLVIEVEHFQLGSECAQWVERTVAPKRHHQQMPIDGKDAGREVMWKNSEKINTHIQAHAYMLTYLQTDIHTYIHTCIQTYKHTNIHTYIHT